MILLEQHIAISIYHQQNLLHFDVMEILTDDGNLIFKVMKQNEYYFTLTGKNEKNAFRLELSKRDRDVEVDINYEIFSKIKIAVYSVFINDKAS